MNPKQIVRQVESAAERMMAEYGISPRTGFLAENPLQNLPQDLGNLERNAWFHKLDAIADRLPEIIKNGEVEKVISGLPVQTWPLDDLPDNVNYRVMLILTMLEHALAKEKRNSSTVQSLLSDESPFYVPPQLAVPLWALHKIIGMQPTASYYLYGPWNWHKIDPGGPISLENVDMNVSFTGDLDESWFVRIHHVIQFVEAPAIRPLLRAYLASEYQDDAPISYITKCLKQAASPLMKRVSVLKRMTEHCNPGPYFEKVRMFYAFPPKIIFEGIPELEGTTMRFEGETGGASPDQQLHDNILQVCHRRTSQEYRTARRKQIPQRISALLEITLHSQVRDVILRNQDHDDAVLAFNAVNWGGVYWGLEHRNLVLSHIKQYGETHGTGSASLGVLDHMIDDRLAALIR